MNVILLLTVIAIALGMVAVFWFILYVKLNDFSLPVRDVSKFEKILVIFPHPDDEVLTVAGLIRSIASVGKHKTLMILTKGEKGNNAGGFDLNLKNVRTSEAIQSASLVGFSEVVHEDLGDGYLDQKKTAVRDVIANYVRKSRPDLVVTFEPGGLYGHPDHIATSEIVTEITRSLEAPPVVWYATFPQKVFEKIIFPVQMAKDPNIKSNCLIPSHRVRVGIKGIIAKIRAMYIHRSQYLSFRNNLPLRWLPLWFFVSVMLWEYFSDGELEVEGTSDRILNF